MKAVIINEKNYFGNSPVNHTFSYSYQFKVDGKTNKGDSQISELKVGDEIIVEFVPGNPDYNQPVELK